MAAPAYKIEKEGGELRTVFTAGALPYAGRASPNAKVTFRQEDLVGMIAHARDDVASGKMTDSRAKNIANLERALDEMSARNSHGATVLEHSVRVRRPLQLKIP